jgi:hypothetical protein
MIRNDTQDRLESILGGNIHSTVLNRMNLLTSSFPPNLSLSQTTS